MQTVSQETCPQCHGTGWARVERDGVEGVVRCECLKGSRVDRLMAKARIPKRYEHCDLEHFEIKPSKHHPSIEKAKVAAERFVEEYPMPHPFGLLFMGPQGTGKPISP